MPEVDFTSKYNTALSSADEQRFQQWLARLSHVKHYDARNDLRDYDLRGAFKTGVTADERGHLTDEFKKPNHPTFSSESIYSGKEGLTGGKWIGADDVGWSYEASPTNLKFRSPEELQQYFQKREPESRLILPRSTPRPLVKQPTGTGSGPLGALLGSI